MYIILIISGLILLILGAELLVRGASRIATFFGISPLIIGLTVVAYGTSAPELAVSLKAGFSGSADIALGNVIGSNSFNVLLILGISALLTPLAVSFQLIRKEVPILIVISAMTWIFAFNGRISRIEGFLLFLGFIIYTIFLIRYGKKVDNLTETLPIENKGLKSLFLQILYVIAGLVLLVLGARWLVDGAVILALKFGINELVIGITIVAAGTSLPELATSVVASIKGERDIAVGNVIGSNIFNILVVLGAASLFTGDINAAPIAIKFDIPLMFGTSVLCLPIFFTGRRISRIEGGLFLFIYIAYISFLIINSKLHFIV